MIKSDARLTVQKIPIEHLQIKCVYDPPRYPDQLLHYIDLLQKYPDEYPGVIVVTPSDTHPGMFAILDGHTRFCASIMMVRKDLWAVVIEEPAV